MKKVIKKRDVQLDVAIILLIIIGTYIAASIFGASTDTYILITMIALLTMIMAVYITAISETYIRRINTNTNNGVKQLESLRYLHNMIQTPLPLPNTRGYAASPDFLCVVFEQIILHQPLQIVELGSGTSSQYIGSLIRDKALVTKVFSIDHSDTYHQQTVDQLAKHGLSPYVSVHHCPIAETAINGKKWQWYDISQVAVPKIDLLIVDGPLRSLQKEARYPAVPMLFEHLNDGAIILVDDYFRKDDTAMVKAWLKEYPQLSLQAEMYTEKGTALLKKLPENWQE